MINVIHDCGKAMLETKVKSNLLFDAHCAVTYSGEYSVRGCPPVS